ncbi:5-methylcytosine-specific restriction enzyme B [Arthrobacter saudimassiliensis]|uniref:5-methylcytosine-specific restriction enzyme B n=1 Tax=Arthrobacter saudimassiliensis TaxID=1461584 RepID=A0A078MTY2_9MICC|nr:5-methylcytosine-specific restriction enzyme B [Arthrobacter saudimassiliensis]
MAEYADVSTFMQWAADLSSEIAWKEEERPYKIAFANKLAGIRQELADGEPGWFDGLLAISAEANLLNWRFLGNLRTTAAGHRDELQAAVAQLWKKDPSPAGLTPFVEEFRALDAEFAPGNVLAFGSVLLMAVDPAAFPPFRAESATRFLKLLGASEVPSNRAQATERYEAFLAGLDALLETAPGSGIGLADRLDAQGLVWLVTNYSPPDAWSPARKREFLAWRNQETVPADEADLRQGPYPVLERAAAAILTPGIAGLASPFDPAVVSWSEANARELYRRVHENYDAGSGTFMGKLEKQLAGADRGVVLLTAELLALQCLPLVNLKPDTKMARVSTVLSWLEEVPDIPEVLKAGLLGTGAFHGGTGFNQQQWRHLCWLAELVASLRSSEDTAARAAASPQGFHDVAEAIPGNLPSIRYSLEYLSWPGFFEPIVSWGHRKKIRNAFAHEIEGASGDDEYSTAKDLYLIRKAQEARTGTRVEWYEEPYVSQWRPAAERAPRAWLVRQSQSGISLAGQWIEDGVVTLEARHLDSVDPDAGLAELQAAVDAGYSHLDYSERRLRARSYHLFLAQMRPDDLIVTVVGGRLRPGVITGDPAYERDGDTAVLTRDVVWQDTEVPTEGLSAPFPRLLEEQGTVIDMTEALPLIRPWVEDVEPGAPEPSAVPAFFAGGVPELREASDELAAKLFVGRDELQEIIGLLQSRNQVVFYGPPGTGKTFLAGRLARYLAGEEHPNHVTTVQFHPSYAYEDFFEGYRPVKGSDGQVGFALVDGPLRRIAGAAAAERDKPFFLIIDEMNRGNLAKVFGELYFLLEYRDQSIDLQYNSDEKFVLPPNLFIIGTMNTADRSIATVDAAIRRRFAFVELHPQDGMTKGMLDRFLAAKGRDLKPARLLDALNQVIDVEKRDLMIGPSYFMRAESETRAGLERIWKYELLPLLEEHYYGALSREDLHARFGLEAIERRINGTPTADW